MFEYFTHYLELKWMAAPAAQTIGPGDKVQTFPDLDNFKLERFKDLRSEPSSDEQDPSKVMLIGSSKTNIFIYGQDSLINIFLIYLPNYIGKVWPEIQNIKLEGIYLHCKNFLFNHLCDPWVIDKFEVKQLPPGGKIQYVTPDDFLKADEICVKCDNFVT